MRLLHTSDWHLGASFYERTRYEEQRAFLDWLLDVLVEKQVDALIVAGDVFDVASPPAEAQSLYYQFLAKLSTLEGSTRAGGRRKAIVVGGNHDSPTRLDAPREVLGHLDTVVVGGYDVAREGHALGESAGLLVPLRDAQGAVQVVVAAVPFLHDYKLGVRGFDASPGEQLQSMHERFAEVYRRLADKAQATFPGARLVATGHLTILAQAGLKVSTEDAVPVEINRVGTLGALSPSVFDPRYAYVALGHIHRGFAVDPDKRVRYSGTPVQVSAVEEASSRKVLLVDVLSTGLQVEELRVPQRRRLLALRGTLAEVSAALGALEVPKKKTTPDTPLPPPASEPSLGATRSGVGQDELPPYVSVELHLEQPDPSAEEKLFATAASVPAKPIVVKVSSRVIRAASGERRDLSLPSADELGFEEALLYAWAQAYPDTPLPPEVLQRFLSLVETSASEVSR